MNASTAPKWIGFIASILDRLRQIFNAESKEPTTTIQNGNKKTERKFLDKGRVEAVVGLTRALDLIFINRELQNLFGLNSLRKITLRTLPKIHITPNSQLKKNSPDEYCNSTVAQSASAAEVDLCKFSFSFRLSDAERDGL